MTKKQTLEKYGCKISFEPEKLSRKVYSLKTINERLKELEEYPGAHHSFDCIDLK